MAGSTPGPRIVVFQRFRGRTPEITGGLHQPGDALAPDPDVVLHPQLGVDARRPVDAAAGVVDLLDLLGQPSILERAIGRRPALPVMQAGAVHAEHATHHSDGIVGLLRGDEREHLAYRPSLSVAKKTAAFERISRSHPQPGVLVTQPPKLLPLVLAQAARALTALGPLPA